MKFPAFAPLSIAFSWSVLLVACSDKNPEKIVDATSGTPVEVSRPTVISYSDDDWSDAVAKLDKKRMRALALDLLKKEPKKLGELLDTISNRDVVRSLIVSLATELGETDPQTGIEIVKNLVNDPTAHRSLYKEILLSSAASDSSKAAEAFEHLPFSNYRGVLGGNLANEIAKNDFDFAFNWVMGMDKADRKHAVNGLSTAISHLQVNKFAELLERVDDAEDKKSFCVNYGRAVKVDNIEEIISEVNRLPATLGETVVDSYVIGTTARGGKVIDIFDQLLEGGHSGVLSRNINQMASYMAMESPSAAANRMLLLKDAEDQFQFSEALVHSWFPMDSIAVSTFISEMSPGVLRDQSASELAQQLMLNGDRESAITWANSINDKGIRDSLLKKPGFN